VLWEDVAEDNGVTAVRVFASMPGGGLAYLAWRSDGRSETGDDNIPWGELYDDEVTDSMAEWMLRFPSVQAFDEWCKQGVELHDRFRRAMGLAELPLD
ncbi:hypothetical protein KKF82_09195, partial [Patescibacteria group bacterium]|nr:hypothetical protein [Patescibacteria group bacterium]